MITAGQVERVLRTITQMAGGLLGGYSITDATGVPLHSTDGALIIIGATILASVAMNFGPAWLRPMAADVEKRLTDTEKTP